MAMVKMVLRMMLKMKLRTMVKMMVMMMLKMMVRMKLRMMVKMMVGMMLMAREWAICHIVRESTGEQAYDSMMGILICFGYRYVLDTDIFWIQTYVLHI